MNIGGRRTIGCIDAAAKFGVEPLAVLADGTARQLREFVITQNVVHAVGILAFEGREHIQELVRTIPVVTGVGKRTMDQLL